MASLNITGFATLDSNGTQNGVVSLNPSSNRNGLVVLKGEESTPTVFPEGTIIQASLSVRPGKAADLVNGIQRVKRKFVMKVRVPVTTPGLVSGAAGTIVDHIDVDLTVSTPVEATESEILTALASCDTSNGLLNSNWVEDMVFRGYDPY